MLLGRVAFVCLVICVVVAHCEGSRVKTSRSKSKGKSGGKSESPGHCNYSRCRVKIYSKHRHSGSSKEEDSRPKPYCCRRVSKSKFRFAVPPGGSDKEALYEFLNAEKRGHDIHKYKKPLDKYVFRKRTTFVKEKNSTPPYRDSGDRNTILTDTKKQKWPKSIESDNHRRELFVNQTYIKKVYTKSLNNSVENIPQVHKTYVQKNYANSASSPKVYPSGEVISNRYKSVENITSHGLFENQTYLQMNYSDSHDHYRVQPTVWISSNKTNTNLSLLYNIQSGQSNGMKPSNTSSGVQAQLKQSLIEKKIAQVPLRGHYSILLPRFNQTLLHFITGNLSDMSTRHLLFNSSSGVLHVGVSRGKSDVLTTRRKRDLSPEGQAMADAINKFLLSERDCNETLDARKKRELDHLTASRIQNPEKVINRSNEHVVKHFPFETVNAIIKDNYGISIYGDIAKRLPTPSNHHVTKDSNFNDKTVFFSHLIPSTSIAEPQRKVGYSLSNPSEQKVSVGVEFWNAFNRSTPSGINPAGNKLYRDLYNHIPIETTETTINKLNEPDPLIPKRITKLIPINESISHFLNRQRTQLYPVNESLEYWKLSSARKSNRDSMEITNRTSLGSSMISIQDNPRILENQGEHVNFDIMPEGESGNALQFYESNSKEPNSSLYPSTLDSSIYSYSVLPESGNSTKEYSSHSLNISETSTSSQSLIQNFTEYKYNKSLILNNENRNSAGILSGGNKTESNVLNLVKPFSEINDINSDSSLKTFGNITNREITTNSSYTVSQESYGAMLSTDIFQKQLLNNNLSVTLNDDTAKKDTLTSIKLSTSTIPSSSKVFNSLSFQSGYTTPTITSPNVYPSETHYSAGKNNLTSESSTIKPYYNPFAVTGSPNVNYENMKTNIPGNINSYDSSEWEQNVDYSGEEGHNRNMSPVKIRTVKPIEEAVLPIFTTEPPPNITTERPRFNTSLIQAPVRTLHCRHGTRTYRGRCRTIWT